jgi:hypothetical protein
MSNVVFEYRPKQEGAYLLGVPARDLTQEEVDALEPQAKLDLAGSDHYLRVGAAMGTQVDPNVPGRTNSDTLTADTLRPVPRDDEPKTEGAVGFLQADRDPSTDVEEG